MRWQFSFVAALVAASGVLAPVAVAQVTVPASASVDVVPAFPGDGLTGKLWFENVSSIAAAETVISSRFSDTAFLSTQGVNYPQGPTNFLPNDGSTLADFLGTDADFLPFDPSSRGIGSNIYQFKGYFAVQQAGTLRLGVGSDDGFRLVIGGVDLGSASDRGFAFSFTNVAFEAAGLYPIFLTYYANSSGESGVMFAEETSGGISPVPVDRLYIVPAPASAALLGAGVLVSLRRRRVA